MLGDVLAPGQNDWRRRPNASLIIVLSAFATFGFMFLVGGYQAFGTALVVYFFGVLCLTLLGYFIRVRVAGNTPPRGLMDHQISAMQRIASRLSPRTRNMLYLSTLQRDFTGNDYEMLMQLDDGVQTTKGLEKGAILRFPTYTMTSADVALSAQRKEYCAICLAPYEAGDQVRTISCLHRYHIGCIDPWLEKNSQCPVCKFECS
jgi:hypothetical protein